MEYNVRYLQIKGIILRCSCGVNRMNGESNGNVYGRFGIASKRKRMVYGVVKVVKCKMLRRFGHLERMDES